VSLLDLILVLAQLTIVNLSSLFVFDLVLVRVFGLAFHHVACLVLM
jgi:hypothetical protein